MNLDDIIDLYGRSPNDRELPAIRFLLEKETKKELAAQGNGNTESMRLLCFYLFVKKNKSDLFIIYNAKKSSMDASCSIDIQLLCGAGLSNTKLYLEKSSNPDSKNILKSITESEKEGDFDGFLTDEYTNHNMDYYFE